jgi:hypothetical protein
MRKMIVLALLCFSAMAFAQTNVYINKGHQAEFLTQDIDNFWDAYDHLNKCHSFQDSIDCITSRYYEMGSEGFTDFIEKYRYTPQDYVKAIGQYPRFYNSIRKNTLVAKTLEKELHTFSLKVSDYFPGYVPKRICFAISPLQDAGTTTDRFILIGTDILASTKKADLSEFGTSIMARLLAFDTNVRERFIFVVAHETAHDLQVHADWNNYELLYRSLLEGSADFIATLLTGVTGIPFLYNYGHDHEKELWVKFKHDIDNNSNSDDWLYNRDRVENGVPNELGYFMGYKIVEKFYKKSPDKKLALKEILEMKNPREFLQKSGYGAN